MNPLYESAMNAPIHHPICDACETVAHCAAHGCIPVEEYDMTQQGFFCWLDFWIAIGAVLLTAAVAFGIYSLWPMVVLAWSQV